MGPSSGETTDVLTRWQLQEPSHFRSCHEFHKYKVLSQSESPGQMLFLKGYPSPEWLGLIGSRYRVDPEFFSRFLDFRSTDNLSNRTSVPSLPSCEWNIIELSLSTIGLMNPLVCHGHQTNLATVRRQSAAALAEINGRILRNSRVPVGSTMIRAVNVLDQTHFVIEQSIAICLQPPENDRGWMGTRRESIVFWKETDRYFSTHLDRQRKQSRGGLCRRSIRLRPRTFSVTQTLSSTHRQLQANDGSQLAPNL